MNKLISWMTDNVEPVLTKISRNPWILAIQQAILTCMPLIFIGSFVLIIGILGNFIPGFPDTSPLSSFSMGLLSMFLSFLVPYNIMEKKRHSAHKKEAGIAGMILFLILTKPQFVDGTTEFVSSTLGNGGMFHALIAGCFAGFVMNVFANISFFKKDSAIPDFITIWFDTLIPMLIIMVTGWIFVYVLDLDLYLIISNLFIPFVSLGDSLIGFIILYFIGYVFLYSFGISSWLVWPLEAAIIYTGLEANQAAVAAGEVATRLNVSGIGSYICLGGSGCTLALAFMFLLFSKSKKNKVIGKSTFIPSMFNINEPLVYGAPIAFNPILMIPFWISGLVAAVLTWFGLYANMIPKITFQWEFWYLPKPLGAFAVGGMSGLLFVAVIFIITCFIYWPFFKIYDNRCLEEEIKEFGDK